MNFQFCKPSTNPNLEFIVATEDPKNVFRCYKFESGKALEDFLKKYNLLNDCIRIDGYNILICYVGTVDKFSTAPTLGHNVPQAIKTTFQALKNFYEQNRIKGNETRLKKFAR